MAATEYGRVQARSDPLTVVSVALTAYAVCDLVHEVLGHGIAAFATGVHITSLSSVALQTSSPSRIVAASGSAANVVAGVAAMIMFRRLVRLSPGGYFAWLSGALNLLNGLGYPLYSALLGSGDWAVVVQGLQPAWSWRLLLGLAGSGAYAAAVVVAARQLARAVERLLVSRVELVRLVFPAYLAGGLLLVVASALNPISPILVLTSGASSGFGAMAGLMLVPQLVGRRTAGMMSAEGAIARSPRWIMAGFLVGALFVALVGPGLHF